MAKGKKGKKGKKSKGVKHKKPCKTTSSIRKGKIVVTANCPIKKK